MVEEARRNPQATAPEDTIRPEDAETVEERRVRRTAKDEDGDIVALCNPYAHWQRVTKWVAMRQLEEGRFRYYVQEEGPEKIYVEVVDGHLRTEADATSKNNLDNLPDC